MTMTKWQLQDFNSSFSTGVKLKSKKQIEESTETVLKNAHIQGFEQGYQDAFQRAKPELDQLKNDLNYLIALLQEPKKIIEKEVEEVLLELIMQIAKYLFCQEIQLSPEKVLPIIQTVISMVPSAIKEKILYLNREDLTLLEKNLSDQPLDLQLIIDEKLQRGECRFESASMQIDATLESRIKDILTQLK